MKRWWDTIPPHTTIPPCYDSLDPSYSSPRASLCLVCAQAVWDAIDEDEKGSVRSVIPHHPTPSGIHGLQISPPCFGLSKSDLAAALERVIFVE